jgi:hypothetical protein
MASSAVSPWLAAESRQLECGTSVHSTPGSRVEQPDLIGMVAQPAAERAAGMVAVVPVPVPGDAEGGCLVITLAQLGQKFRIRRRIAPGPGAKPYNAAQCALFNTKKLPALQAYCHPGIVTSELWLAGSAGRSWLSRGRAELLAGRSAVRPRLTPPPDATCPEIVSAHT